MAALSNLHPPYLYIRNISTSFSFNNEVCRKRWLTLRPRIFQTRKFATGPRIISDHCLAGIIRGTQLFPYAHSEGPCQFFEEFDTGPPTILKAIWTWSQEILMHKNTHFPSPVLLKIWRLAFWENQACKLPVFHARGRGENWWEVKPNLDRLAHTHTPTLTLTHTHTHTQTWYTHTDRIHKHMIHDLPVQIYT